MDLQGRFFQLSGLLDLHVKYYVLIMFIIFLSNLFQSQVIDTLLLELKQIMKTYCHLIYAIVGQTGTETI